jgi:hypothetical protein
MARMFRAWWRRHFSSGPPMLILNWRCDLHGAARETSHEWQRRKHRERWLAGDKF